MPCYLGTAGGPARSQGGTAPREGGARSAVTPGAGLRPSIPFFAGGGGASTMRGRDGTSAARPGGSHQRRGRDQLTVHSGTAAGAASAAGRYPAPGRERSGCVRPFLCR